MMNYNAKKLMGQVRVKTINLKYINEMIDRNFKSINEKVCIFIYL